MDTFWYAKRIGQVFKTLDRPKFDEQHTIRLNNGKRRAPYGLVKLTDAEVVHPNFIQKLLIGLGFHNV